MMAVLPFLRLPFARSWRVFVRDRNRHASSNAGQSEAVMARALGIQLGGASYYFGRLVKKPTIGNDLYQPAPIHIEQANRIMVATTIAMALFLLCGRVFLGCWISAPF